MTRTPYYPRSLAGLGQAYGDCSRWLEDRWEHWSWVVGFWRACQDLRTLHPGQDPAQLPAHLGH